jgi:hypothetical protein
MYIGDNHYIDGWKFFFYYMLGVLMTTIILCYYLFGIIILCKDYNICNDNNLWQYCLFSLLLFCNKFCFFIFTKNKDTICLPLSTTVIEFSITIWGMYELLIQSDNCDIVDTRLWNFGMINFILQIMFSVIFFLLTIKSFIESFNTLLKSDTNTNDQNENIV